MFCKRCGTENPDTATYCSRCNSPLQNQAQPQQQSAQTTYNYQPPQQQQYQQPQYQHAPATKPSYASLVLGIIGIIFAWIFALVGHVTSIIGIVLGAKEYKATGNIAGLVLSIIGEICSIISSVLGVLIVSAML